MLATHSPQIRYYIATRQACMKSGGRPSRRCTLCKLIVRMASSDARIVSLEASQSQQDKDIAYLQYKAATNHENVKALRTTDNALLQVVEKRGTHYANLFKTQLKEFENALGNALEPLRSDVTAIKEAQTALKDAQRSDMAAIKEARRNDMAAIKEAQRNDMAAVKEAQTALKADNTIFRTVGGFVVTAFGLVVTLYEAGLKNIPGVGRAFGLIAAFVLVTAMCWQFYQMKQDMSKFQKQLAEGLPKVAEESSKLHTQVA